ncbi:PAT complex subunit CCDC47 [Halotydeus destructor]|nr:PAT complex subunit CCDC47 [Halotydeus destructor]
MFISSRGRRTSTKLITFTLSVNLVLALVLEICVLTANAKLSGDAINFDDNEFAEFEEFDEEESKLPAVKPAQQLPTENPSRGLPDEEDDTEGLVEDEDDEDIFENVKEGQDFGEEAKDKEEQKGGLKFTKVPMHLRNNWQSYYMEILMGAGILIYFVNYFVGRSKNQSLANAWFEANRDILESNFSLVGDDGKKEIEYHGLMKETESVFTLWCSGRASVEGLLVEIKLLKRHDIVSTIARLMKPSTDEIVLKVQLNDESMDNYVFCLSTKKTATRLVKEMNDIATFCPDRKSVEKLDVNDDKFVMFNEIGEVASTLLDSKVTTVIDTFEDYIDYIQISDQYSGMKMPDETPMIKLPEVNKTMVFAFNCSTTKTATTTESMENLKALTQLVFYMLEKVKRLRLSREAKLKSDKNRQRVEAIYMKATHAQRQELAQTKREERRRVEKEKILNEEDPDKQRRWEEKEHKREMKRKTPRMKQLKVKAM